MELTGDQKSYLQLLAYFFMQSGKDERAVALLKVLRRMEPDDMGIAASYAFSAVNVGRYSVALEETERILAHPGCNAETKIQGLQIQSSALWGLNRKKTARKVFRQLVAMRDEQS